MKTALELYSNADGLWPSYVCGYQAMLEEFGKIVIQVDDHDYQGDTRVLYEDGTRYGWLQFGWGSCSGCDSLKACSTPEEVQELMDNLYSDIRWFDNKAECLEFCKTHDWEGDYSWHSEEQHDFINQVLTYLESTT